MDKYYIQLQKLKQSESDNFWSILTHLLDLHIRTISRPTQQISKCVGKESGCIGVMWSQNRDELNDVYSLHPVIIYLHFMF